MHRDLKPANVLLAADGPRVIDFGIARAMDATSVTTAGSIPGTAAYMSPEQVRGQEAEPPSDVFALGCVLYFATTGRSPFGGGPTEAIVYRVVHEDPDLDDLPDDLRDLVRACLAKDVAARPTVAQVLDRLRPASGDVVPWRLPDGVGPMVAERARELRDLQAREVAAATEVLRAPGAGAEAAEHDDARGRTGGARGPWPDRLRRRHVWWTVAAGAVVVVAATFWLVRLLVGGEVPVDAVDSGAYSMSGEYLGPGPVDAPHSVRPLPRGQRPSPPPAGSRSTPTRSWTGCSDRLRGRPGMGLELLNDSDPRQAGPYHLRGRLRVSRVGATYLGRSPDGLFAEVTVVNPQLAWDPQLLGVLSADIDVARRVRASHVQRFRASDLGARAPWFAVDFLPGPSLRDAVEAYGPLQPAAVRALAAGLAQALDTVHATGLVHRGLNPSAVVITSDGPVVIGLGIERALEAATVTLPRLVPGAVAYLAPEITRGYEPGPPADIFGLGAVLAYAATGHGPFGTGDSSELARRMRQDEPDLIGLPDDLLEVVAACVRAGAGERPTLVALRRRLSSGRAGSWDLPADLTDTFAQWAVLGRGRSAPLPPAISAEPTTPLGTESEPVTTKKLGPMFEEAEEEPAESAQGPGQEPTARPVSIVPPALQG